MCDFFTIYAYGWSLTEVKATFRLNYLSVNAQFIHIFIKLDFQMSIDLVLTKRELTQSFTEEKKGLDFSPRSGKATNHS